MARVMGRRIAARVGLLTGLLVLVLAGVAQARTIVVQNGNDTGSGSLREAIAEATNGDTIQIPTGVGPIEPTTQFQINSSIKIEGTGSGRATIDAHHKCRIFTISNASVELSDLRIAEGKVTTTGTMSDEVAIGGGLSIISSLVTLDNDFFERNEAAAATSGMRGDAAGGAIAANLGSGLILRNTILTDNRAAGSPGVGPEAFGGAIATQGGLIVEGGEIKGNAVQGYDARGGGLYFQSLETATLKGVSVTGNEAIPSTGQIGLTRGGGIDHEEGTMTLEGVTVERNRVDSDAPTGTVGVAEGGGLRAAAPVTVVNSTFSANLASSVVAENGLVRGGALESIESTATIVNSTLVGNTAQTGGTNSLAAGGDLWGGTKVTVGNSILAGGLASGAPQNCAGLLPTSIASGGHNIDGGASCGFNGAGDLSNTDPKVGPLAENGGPVKTMALLAGSPAIDGGGSARCPETDARGVLRPAGAACDIGAFEVATPIAVTEAAGGISTAGATLIGSATNPALSGGKVFFQYGTATGYESHTPEQAIGATTRGARIATAVGGLTPNTTYHFRIVVTNGTATAVGPDMTFNTASLPRDGNGGGPQRRVTLKHLKGLRFRIHCQGGRACTGNLVARARAGRRTIVVAKAKVRVAGGKTKAVTLKATRKGKPLLARPGELPVVVKATIKGAAVPKPLHLKLG
jgi:hypothetical protein